MPMSAEVTRSEEWTVGRLLTWTRDFLRRKGIDQPQLCAQLLLAHALECERLELYLQFEATPEQGQLDALRELVRRASQGEPIAHLIGQKEFFSLTIRVSPDVLIPRPETETLVETVVDVVRTSDRPVGRILELGTGSGCVAVALATQLADVKLIATDVSAEALKVAEDNVIEHGLADRVELRQGNLFEAPAGELDRFDVILANPPYVKTDDLTGQSADVARCEPRIALDGGADGLDVIRRIVAESPDRLAEGGWLALEVGYDQADQVRDLFQAAGFDQVRAVKDGLGHERVVVGRRS